MDINTKKYVLTIERSDGKKIQLGRGQTFGILNLEGFESTDYELKTMTGAQQIGAQVLGTTILERHMVITAVYTDVATAENINQELIHFFSPMLSYTIVFDNCGVRRKIECRLENGYQPAERKLVDPLIFTVGFLAPDALWNDVETFNKNMADHTSLFFCRGNNGFAIPARGAVLSARQFNEITTIFNKGDFDTGIMLTFYAARGRVVNPSIAQIDRTTRGIKELLRVNITMQQYDKLTIDTNLGRNRIELNGENISNRKDRESVFFQMHVGENTLRYGAETGRDNLNVWPNWTQKYWGA